MNGKIGPPRNVRVNSITDQESREFDERRATRTSDERRARRAAGGVATSAERACERAGARGIFVFVFFGVLVAPLATSFLDAAAMVITGWGHGYWPRGAERFWTNALAELTVVPAIVLVGLNGNTWIRTANPVRCWEAALWGASTILVTVFVFGFHFGSAASIPAMLCFPLPLLLWSAASKLQYLGVAAGMESWCKEFGERQGMKINFKSDVDRPLPFEIGHPSSECYRKHCTMQSSIAE